MQMILKILLYTQMIWMISITILKNKIQVKCETSIIFADMISDIDSNKKRHPIVTEFFIRSRKLKVCFVFALRNLTLLYLTIFN